MQYGMYSHGHKYMWAYSYYFVHNVATTVQTVCTRPLLVGELGGWERG